MSRLDQKRINQRLRKRRVRSTVIGTAERPRLSVSISNRNVSAQVIDDSKGKTLASSTTAHAKASSGTMTELAAIVGADIAKKAAKLKIKKVAFDRNGRAYQQRLAALADAARKNGLEF